MGDMRFQPCILSKLISGADNSSLFPSLPLVFAIFYSSIYFTESQNYVQQEKNGSSKCRQMLAVKKCAL
jgi:hypothetical protein